MATFLQKSNLNNQAAKLLIKKAIFGPSVNCNYYCVFQHIKSTLNNKCNISYETQQKKTRGKDSHKIIISLFKKQLSNSGVEQEDITNFNDTYKNLKLLRIAADYDEEKITSKKANEANTLREELINFIKNEYYV